jgi:hypothetical protein
LDTLSYGVWDYKHFTLFKVNVQGWEFLRQKGYRRQSGRHVFYVDKDIDRIVTYCEKDTIAVAQIFFFGEKIY